MINLLRSEWIKLHTITMNWVLGLIAAGFPLLVTLLTAYFSGDDDGFSANNLVSVLTGTSVVSALLCGIIAAASISSEFGFGTIRPTFAATPQRTRVIVAKALVVVAATTVVATVVQLVGWFVGGAIAESRGATIVLADEPNALPAMVGVIGLTALLSLAGFGVGMLTRSTPASVTILIVWPLIAEALVGQLLALVTGSQAVARWMPFQAGIRLAVLDVFEDDGPSRVASGVYFAAVALGFAALGGWFVNRRDA